jgi:hypothetical protein
LKVLGKGDFKALMKWRLAIRLEIGLDVKADPAAEVTEDVNVEPMDEEEQISEEVSRYFGNVYQILNISSNDFTRPGRHDRSEKRNDRTRRSRGISSNYDST